MSAQGNADQALDAEPQPNGDRNDPDRQPVALVVDDEPLVRRLICSVLANLGWGTIEAADGSEAVRVAGAKTISLLITDYDMPGIKGIEVADTLRGLVADLPVVLVSGLPSVGQLANTRGYRFLAKPFDPGELASIVRTLEVVPAGSPGQL